MVNQLTLFRALNWLSLMPVKTLVFLISFFSYADAAIVDSRPNNHKTVQIAVTDIPSSFYPYSKNGLNAQFSHLFFDPLVRWGQQNKIELRLVERYRWQSNGKIRFYLKRKIAFHSGNQLTANDVIWSLNEALKNERLREKFHHIIKIERINKYQFDIETALTEMQLLDYLTQLLILDSNYYIKNSAKNSGVNLPVDSSLEPLPLSGTGPYQVASFYAGVNLRVQASSTYWQKNPAYKSLNFIKIQSMDSRLYALLANDIDIAEAISNKQIDSPYLLEHKNIYQIASSNALFLTINTDKNNIFENPDARKAIHLSINRAGMLKHILNNTGGINALLNRSPSPYASQGGGYDVKKAEFLLKKINVPKQLSLLVMVDEVSYTNEVVDALKNMFNRVGIKLSVTEVETVEQWKQYQFQYDFTLFAWQSVLINHENIYQNIFDTSLLADYIQGLFNKQNKTLTMHEKIALFGKYQATERIVPLFSQNDIWSSDKNFDLQSIFSINAIPYWHLLTTSH